MSEPYHHTTKFFTEHLLVKEMKKKKQILMNKPVYLGLSIHTYVSLYTYKQMIITKKKFLSEFPFTNIHESQDCRGRGKVFL